MASASVRLPYSSWTAMRSFVDHLSTIHLPDRIDESVFPEHLSKATIEQVWQSLRRLALIGKGGTPTPALRRLLESGVDGWRHLLKESYKEFFDAGWERITPKQFLALLEARGAKGATAGRAARFVLQALRHTGIPYSDLLEHIVVDNRPQKPPGRATSLRDDAARPFVSADESSYACRGRLDTGS